MSNLERKTFLFTLRVWAEPLEDSQVEWRGRLQPLPEGEAHYFRGWAGLVERLESMLEPDEQHSDPGSHHDQGETS